jgi:DNA-binding transcriptional MerR regulator
MHEMFTIGQVAKRYSLSRSALIYYDNKGVLKPSGRSDANYRLYTEDDIKKLERIVLFRNTGLSLSAIKGILNQDADDVEIALEKRLISINREIQDLRSQQSVILSIIKNQDAIAQTRIITKDRWVAMMRAVGLSEGDMWNWHVEFEKTSPEAHQDFLESIGISSEEINSIRELSRGKKPG